MSDLPEELDLKFLPDWLKETPAVNRYADFQGEPERRGGDREERSGRDERRGPPRGTGPRGPRDGPRERRGGPPQGERRGDRNVPRKGGPPQARERQGESSPRPEPPARAGVQVEFLPEPSALAAIAKQIRHGARAYPLFGTARLFLDRPERYRVRITATDPGVLLYQIDDGPIAFDRAVLERDAFRQLKANYFREEAVQHDPPKGNFSSVARVRATGALLGPTNHHGYQPALRKLYEERFSRRMSFPEFQHREIEIVVGEQAVNDWKEQARSVITYLATQEAEPLTFKSLAEAEQHFRTAYLPGLIRSGQKLETSGVASHQIGDRSIYAALRDGWEKERGFPGSLVNHLRPAFVEAGLHFFKHRKRIIYISPIRPQRHATAQPMSDSLAAILAAIEAAPRCTRHDLAVKLLGEQIDAPELTPRKTALAGDLHYLVHAGHVIEFADGTLDLPLAPKVLEAESEERPPASSSKHGEQAQVPSPAPAQESAPAEAVSVAAEPGSGNVALAGKGEEAPAPDSQGHDPGAAAAEASASGSDNPTAAPATGTLQAYFESPQTPGSLPDAGGGSPVPSSDTAVGLVEITGQTS